MLDHVQAGAGEAGAARVFISYSRKDLEFAERLVAALSGLGFDAYLDKKDIAPGEPWRERLTGLIEAADTVVFLLSPDSVASDICAWEVDEAERMAKRVLPAVARRVEAAKVPGRLRRLNWIDFTQGHGFEAALGELKTALLTDIAWVREHTRLVGLAEHWAKGGRPADRVMSPADIGATERLLEGRPRNADPPPQALADFLAASRARLEEEMRRLRRTTGRAFVKPAEEALKEGRHENAVRLCAAGALLADDLDFELVPELWSTAVRAISENRTFAVLKGHTSGLLDVAFSPNGQSIVTASSDKTARIWDALTGSQLAVLKGHGGAVESAAFSPDGERVLTAGGKTARIWDIATGKQIAAWRVPYPEVQDASFSPDGQRVVTAAGRDAWIWNAATGQQVASLEGHRDYVKRATFSPDGQQIVTASHDKTARIWDAAKGKQMAILNGHTGWLGIAAFNPDGKRIVTAAEFVRRGRRSRVPRDFTVRIWDSVTGKQVAIMEGHHSWLTSAAYSPDGHRIVTASRDDTARVWEAASGKAAAIFESARWNRLVGLVQF